MSTLWEDKYEPKTLDEMILHWKTRANLLTVMRDCPHVILYGQPGTGKTTFTKIFFQTMNYLRISGKKGIAIIRAEVEPFAKGDYLGAFFHIHGETPIRYIIINEADWLNEDCQAELRTIVEDYQTKARFAFITNEVDKLTDQIRSRCREIEFEKAQPEM